MDWTELDWMGLNRIRLDLFGLDVDTVLSVTTEIVLRWK